MDRLIHLINRYTNLSSSTLDFLLGHGRMVTQPKGYVFIQYGQRKMYYCLLLDGMIGYLSENENGGETLQKIGLPYHYFVGTKHVFSNRSATHKIIFLQDAAYYMISNKDFQYGIKNYPELNLLYHILKQRNLDVANHFIHLNRIDRKLRLHYLYHHFPYAAHKLTVRSLCSLLGFTNLRQYYKALTYHHAQK